VSKHLQHVRLSTNEEFDDWWIGLAGTACGGRCFIRRLFKQGIIFLRPQNLPEQVSFYEKRGAISLESNSFAHAQDVCTVILT